MSGDDEGGDRGITIDDMAAVKGAQGHVSPQAHTGRGHKGGPHNTRERLPCAPVHLVFRAFAGPARPSAKPAANSSRPPSCTNVEDGGCVRKMSGKMGSAVIHFLFGRRGGTDRKQRIKQR